MGIALVGLSGCENDWEKTELAMSTTYSEEYGKMWVYNNHEKKHSTRCLNGVEYWKGSRSLAVKYNPNGKISLCNLKTLDDFKGYLGSAIEERKKWTNIESK